MLVEKVSTMLCEPVKRYQVEVFWWMERRRHSLETLLVSSSARYAGGMSNIVKLMKGDTIRHGY
jgi:hypothetical protein